MWVWKEAAMGCRRANFSSPVSSVRKRALCISPWMGCRWWCKSADKAVGRGAEAVRRRPGSRSGWGSAPSYFWGIAPTPNATSLNSAMRSGWAPLKHGAATRGLSPNAPDRPEPSRFGPNRAEPRAAGIAAALRALPPRLVSDRVSSGDFGSALAERAKVVWVVSGMPYAIS